jgi:hypothetical protein
MRITRNASPAPTSLAKLQSGDVIARWNGDVKAPAMLGKKGALRPIKVTAAGKPAIVTKPEWASFPQSDYVRDGRVLLIGKLADASVKAVKAPKAPETDKAPKSGRTYPTCDACGKRMPVNPAHTHKCAKVSETPETDKSDYAFLADAIAATAGALAADERARLAALLLAGV